MNQHLLAKVGLLASLLASTLAAASPQSTLEQRFTQDRTGVCVVAAVVEAAQVQRARFCAQARSDGTEPGYGHLFEIGSVSKTMTAALVADLIGRGRWRLDDPIAKHLPAGTLLPRQDERQILVRDLLTHSAGLPALPPGFAPKNPLNPYADLSEAQLLAALGGVELTRTIGSQAEYSNFGMMLVSAAVARSSDDGDFEQALVQRLFEPLQMRSAFVSQPRGKEAPSASGHLPSGQPAQAWTITPNLAGVGMVRASLDDMTRYAQAQLGLLAGLRPELQAALKLTQQPLREQFGMNWMRFKHQGRELLVHEGGTGGFSSLVLLEPAAGRAVVLLADTALTDLGGLGDVGRALAGLSERPQAPRLRQAAPAQLLAAMVGAYEIGGMPTRLWLDGGQLMAQVEGQAAFELDHDSHGDFYPRQVSALLTPEFVNGKVERALWRQGGGAVELRRTGPRSEATASDPRWRDLVGEYALTPQFSLRIFEADGQLKLQGTGQPSITADMSGPDRIEVKAVGAVVEFQRDAEGRVRSAVLLQGGQRLEGQRK